MSERQDEIELMDYLNVLWKRKWIIILPTLFCAIAAALISFLLPRIWEVDSLIQPSKIFIQRETGVMTEVVFMEPQQVASQINRESYNHIIATEQNLDLRDFPKIKAESLEDTKLIRVSVRDHDVGQAKAILSSLFRHLKTELDGKADVEAKGIDSQINANLIQKARLEGQIEIANNKVKIAEARTKEIESEMTDTHSRVENLEKEQLSTLRSEKKSEAESLGLLLYSNEIQQSLRYLDTLKQLLDAKKIEEEDLRSDIDDAQKKIMQMENNIEVLKAKKGMIDYTQLVKEPTTSINPVFPRRKLIVAISIVAGLMIFAFVALFLEYIERHENKS